MYEISYSKSAERYLKKIRDKHLLAAFKSAIDKLKIDPYIWNTESRRFTRNFRL